MQAAMLRELHQIVPGTWSELENLLKAVLPFSWFSDYGKTKDSGQTKYTARSDKP